MGSSLGKFLAFKLDLLEALGIILNLSLKFFEKLLPLPYWIGPCPLIVDMPSIGSMCMHI